MSYEPDPNRYIVPVKESPVPKGRSPEDRKYFLEKTARASASQPFPGYYSFSIGANMEGLLFRVRTHNSDGSVQDTFDVPWQFYMMEKMSPGTHLGRSQGTFSMGQLRVHVCFEIRGLYISDFAPEASDNGSFFIEWQDILTGMYDIPLYGKSIVKKTIEVLNKNHDFCNSGLQQIYDEFFAEKEEKKPEGVFYTPPEESAFNAPSRPFVPPDQIQRFNPVMTDGELATSSDVFEVLREKIQAISSSSYQSSAELDEKLQAVAVSASASSQTVSEMVQAMQAQQALLDRQGQEVAQLKELLKSEISERLESEYREELRKKEAKASSMRTKLRQMRKKIKDQVKEGVEYASQKATETSVAIVKREDERSPYWSVKGALQQVKDKGAKAAVELTLASLPIIYRWMGGD